MSCLLGGILTLWGVMFFLALIVGIVATVIGGNRKTADASYEAMQGEALNAAHAECYRPGPRVEDHDTNSTECWCEPELMQLCPEWRLAGDKCDSTCWRCRGKGWVEPYDADIVIVIVHRRNLLRRGA